MTHKLPHPSLEALVAPYSPWVKNAHERANMTIACHDADYLPRVKDAGTVTSVEGVAVQMMHNGLLVEENGYQGGWQAKTIKALKGVHEPQEEKVFFEVIKRIDRPTYMMELGSWWAYYTMWYLKSFPSASAVCCEPDPVNIALGRRNMQYNKIDSSRVYFSHSASGAKEGRMAFVAEDKKRSIVDVKSVDHVMKENKIDSLDILHMDIQGAEVDALRGAENAIAHGKIRFIFVSTHHYSISEDPSTHRRCRDFLIKHGATIVAEHSVQESCSGDGLIVASFSSKDKDFMVDISKQSTYDSLFRPYDDDLAILWNKYAQLVKENEGLAVKINALTESVDYHVALVHERNRELDEIKTLKKHAAIAIKKRLNI